MSVFIRSGRLVAVVCVALAAGVVRPGQKALPVADGPDGQATKSSLVDASLRAAFEHARYAAQEDPAVPGVHHLSNAAHGLRARVAQDAVIVATTEAEVRMELTGVGYGDDLRRVSALETSASGTRVTVQKETAGGVALTEWWVNRVAGLEQGFTIDERPAHDGTGAPLRLSLRITSDLTSRELPDGSGIEWLDDTGRQALRYDHLVVVDAASRILPARMRLRADVLTLEVEDAAATYPVTIDPLFTQQAYVKASNTETGDNFGGAVAISGNTAVIGARFEDSGATGVNGDQSNNSLANAGAVYVFVRSGATWTQQAYLKSSIAADGQFFGSSVAIDGDTIAVGAPWNRDIANYSGAVHVFARNGTIWSQQAYLKASNPGDFDDFGTTVAVSGDTVAVTAVGEDGAATGVNGDQTSNAAADSGAAYVFVRTGVTWAQQAYLKASNTQANDAFGYSAGLAGDTLVIGAYREDSAATGTNGDQAGNAATDAGAAYVFVRNGGTWTQQAYLKASNTGVGDSFGFSVSLSGETVVVGAPSEDSNATGVNGDQSNNGEGDSGAAYVFLRNGTNWSQQAYLKASNTGGGDGLGRQTAISGNLLVVGAPFEDSDGNENNNGVSSAGAGYVFERSGSAWAQRAYLKASNIGSSDQFGTSVAIAGDTVLAGAVGEDGSATGIGGVDNNSASDAGAAYAFFFDRTVPDAPTGVTGASGNASVPLSWSAPANTGSSAITGYRVQRATTVAGTYTDAAGCPTNSTATSCTVTGLTNGTQYFFKVSATNSQGTGPYSAASPGVTPWPTTQQAFAKASNTNAFDLLGCTVAISGDTAVVGACAEDSNATGVNGDQTNDAADGSGAAYVFVRTASGWAQQAYLKASNTQAGDLFGADVAISGDTIVIGATGEGSSATGVNGDQGNDNAFNSGAAYVFQRNGSTWTQQAYLKASNTEEGDLFGIEVAISGETIVVGAPSERSSATGVNGVQTDNSAIDSGAVYVFVRSGSSWTQQAYIKASNTNTSDEFGAAVAVSGDTIIAGAPREDSAAIGVNGDQNSNAAGDSGAAYVFTRTGSTWSQQAYLKASNTGVFDGFGGAVGIDGDTVVVGADGEDSAAAGVNGNQGSNTAESSGAAYVFVRTGTTWTQQAYLKASNPGGRIGFGGWGDRFGLSVALSGQTIVIGAPNEDSAATGINGNQTDNSAFDAGAAYVFTRAGSAWSQRAYVKASNTGSLDEFHIVAVSGDALVVGARRESSSSTGTNGANNDDADGAGAAYFFLLSIDGAPGAPASVTGTGGNAQVALSWTAPASAGSSAITGYQVRRATNVSGLYTDAAGCATSSTTTSCTAAGLTNGTPYFFKVAAINTQGLGEFSAASLAITPATTPGAPAITGVTPGHGSLAVAFTAPASDGGAPITNYAYSTDNGANWTTRSPAAVTSPLTIGSLVNGTTYHVRILAINARGNGPASGMVEVAPRSETVERLLVGLGTFPSDGGWIPARADRASAFAARRWPRLPWDAYNAQNGELHPAVGNLDDDPLHEVVIGLGTGGGGWIVVLDDGANDYAVLRWIRVQWASYNASNGAVWPAVGDLDGDGRAEIVAGLGSGSAGWIEIFDDAVGNFAHVGWRQVDWASYNAANGETHPAVADLDGNGSAEIVLGLGAGGLGYLQILEGSAPYAHRAWLQTSWGGYNTTVNGPTFPAAGDLDGDGKAEIVIGLGIGGGGYLEVRDDASQDFAFVRWLWVGWGSYNETRGESHPAIGNLDNDASAEIAIGLASFDGQGGWVEVLDDAQAGFARLWWLNAGWTAFIQGGGATFPAIGDLRR